MMTALSCIPLIHLNILKFYLIIKGFKLYNLNLVGSQITGLKRAVEKKLCSLNI